MPGDLNLKKSWNPALMKNQKKVWEREQQALKELQTIKQRQKEIAQEREKEEMIRLQYGSDPASMPSREKLELNKLGWMYNDGPKKSEDPESGFREVDEDFLAKSGEVEQLLRGSKAVKTSVGSRFDKVASVGAVALPTSLSDDPLVAIRRERFKKRSDQRERSPDRVHGSRSQPGASSSDSRRDRDGSRSSYRDSHRHHRDGHREREREGDRDRERGHRRSHEKSSSERKYREHRSDRDSRSSSVRSLSTREERETPKISMLDKY